jgi:histidyl-tRNA synthetase
MKGDRVSFSVPRGMRDFLFQEMQKREEIIEKIKKVYKKYGFLPMDTPALEYLEVLEKKCGEEIKNQIFKLDDQKLALRFDLTVPLARVASSHVFKKPLKRYCIAPVWRKEEPQKGRFREFLQADIDIIGSPSVKAEAELLACACEALKELGFNRPTILLNDRRIAYKIASEFSKGSEQEFLRLLDKKNKLSSEEFLGQFSKILTKEKFEKFKDFLKISSSSNEEKIKFAKTYSLQAAEDLENIIKLSKEYDEEINIVIDLSLVRGLDYYTGPIFEIVLGEEIGSVGGGGRYDNLLSLYGQGDYACGISLGIERIFFLLKQNSFRKIDLFVANTKSEFYTHAIKVASLFRKEGINTMTDLNDRPLSKQLEFASEFCKFIAIIGQNEVKAGKITLRNLKTGEENLLTFQQAVDVIKKSNKILE